jgi:hypothetical protein
MANSDLISFDPRKLVQRINSIIAPSEGTISLGESRNLRIPRNSIHDLVYGRTLQKRERFQLLQNAYRGISGVLDIPSEINIGEIYLEQRSIEGEDWYYDTTEMFSLILNSPLTLKDNRILPKCKIDIDQTKNNLERRDRESYLFVLKRKINLSEILPTEYFFAG